MRLFLTRSYSIAETDPCYSRAAGSMMDKQQQWTMDKLVEHVASRSAVELGELKQPQDTVCTPHRCHPPTNKGFSQPPPYITTKRAADVNPATTTTCVRVARPPPTLSPDPDETPPSCSLPCSR